MSHILSLTVIDLRFGALCKKFWQPAIIFILQCSIIPQNDDIHHFYSCLHRVKEREIVFRVPPLKKWHLQVDLLQHSSMVNYFIDMTSRSRPNFKCCTWSFLCFTDQQNELTPNIAKNLVKCAVIASHSVTFLNLFVPLTFIFAEENRLFHCMYR